MNKTKAATQRLTAVHNYIIFLNIKAAGRFYECSEWKAELLPLKNKEKTFYLPPYKKCCIISNTDVLIIQNINNIIIGGKYHGLRFNW